MSDKKTIIIGDDMIENRLKEKSIKLGISVDELIDRYIRRGLYSDDYYESPQLTMEELLEMSKKDVKKIWKMEFLQKSTISILSLENSIGMISSWGIFNDFLRYRLFQSII